MGQKAEPDVVLDTIFAMTDVIDSPLFVLASEPLSILRANPAATALLGPDWRLPFPVPPGAFGGAAAEAAFAAAFGEAAEASGGVQFILSFEPGRERRFFCKVSRLPQRPDLAIATLAERSPASARWRESLFEILDLLPVGLEVYDAEFNSVFYNKASDDLFLYDEKEIVHHDEWWELGFPDPVARAAVIAEWRAALKVAQENPGEPQVTDWVVRCRDGQYRNIQFRFRWIGLHYVVVAWDLTDQRRLQEELRVLAESDSLTGLWNRRRFMQAAEAAFTAFLAAGRSLAVLMLDIDHFKSINDRFGHGVGDTIIRIVGERCRAVLRSQDVIARVGGEEFAVLLPMPGCGAAAEVAERILQAVSGGPVLVGDQKIEVGISIGGSWCRTGDRVFADVLVRADRALYRAKNAGRGHVVLAGEEEPPNSL